MKPTTNDQSAGISNLLRGKHPVSTTFEELDNRIRAAKHAANEENEYRPKTWHEENATFYYGSLALQYICNALSIILSIIGVTWLIAQTGIPYEVAFIAAIIFLSVIEIFVKNALIAKATMQYIAGNVGLSRNTAIVTAVVVIISGALTVASGGQVPVIMNGLPMPNGITTAANASFDDKEALQTKIAQLRSEKETILAARAQRTKETGKVSWYGTEQEKQLNTGILNTEAQLSALAAKQATQGSIAAAAARNADTSYLIKIYATLIELIVCATIVFNTMYRRRRYYERLLLAKFGTNKENAAPTLDIPYPTDNSFKVNFMSNPPLPRADDRDANSQAMPTQAVYTRIYDFNDPDVQDLFGKFKNDMKTITTYQNKLNNEEGDPTTNQKRINEAQDLLAATEAKLAMRGVGVKKESNKYVLYHLEQATVG